MAQEKISHTSQDEDPTPEGSPLKRRQLVLRIVGAGFLALALMLLFYGAVALMAYQNGEQLRVARQQAEQLAELNNQLALAEENITAGNFDLALRRIDWVLAQDPNNSTAVELQQIAQNGLTAPLTPSPTPTSPPPTATPEIPPTPDPAVVYDEVAAEEAFEALTALMEKGEWDTAVEDLISFQNSYPSHRRGETDQMLYDAYIGLGRRLLLTEQVERGLFYLGQAERLGNLPEEVRGEISFAELYLEGIVFYNVNWEAFFYYFRELCTYAPNYQNACGLLVEGLGKQGDLFAFQEDWCPAASYYAEGTRWQGSGANGLGEKLGTARANCAQATPTPGAITGTTGITGTEPISVTP